MKQQKKEYDAEVCGISYNDTKTIAYLHVSVDITKNSTVDLHTLFGKKIKISTNDLG